MGEARTFTVSEASYVLGLKPSEINRAVDKKVIKAVAAKGGPNRRRAFGTPELRFLRVDQQLQKTLTPEGRRQLYLAVSKMPPSVHSAKVGPVIVDFKEVDAELDRRINMLANIRNSVDLSGGDALIKGTKISAYQIAALGAAHSVNEIIADYPSLSRAQVESAIEYSRAYPKKGRPYPGTTFKKALSDLVDLGIFDDDPSESD